MTEPVDEIAHHGLASYGRVGRVVVLCTLTATYLINRTPSRILQGKAPLHILQPSSILFSIISRVFECTCFVQNWSPPYQT